MNLFRLNDYDTVAAETMEEAIRSYCDASGETPEECLEDPSQLTDEQINSTMIRLDDGFGTLVTFRQHLDDLIAEGAVFPRLFSSTEV